jgi:HlyD family secretion protein
MVRNRWAALAFGTAVAAAVAWSLGATYEPSVPIVTTAVIRRTIRREILAPGRLEPAIRVRVSAAYSGVLSALRVREGELVRAGTILGSVSYEKEAFQSRGARAVQAARLAELEAERVLVNAAQQELARADELHARGLLGDAALSDARGTVARREARAAGSGADVACAGAMVTEADLREHEATLRAPVTGTVTGVRKRVGERVVGAGVTEDVILEIVSLARMYAKVHVAEHEVTGVKAGHVARVSLGGTDDVTFPARVIDVARYADSDRGERGARVATFEATLEFDAPLPHALPGMSAEAVITTDVREAAVVVPVAALTVRAPAQSPAPGRSEVPIVTDVVFVAVDGRARMRPVEKGIACDGEVEIVTGLEAGERLIQGPSDALWNALSEGTPVSEERVPTTP